MHLPSPRLIDDGHIELRGDGIDVGDTEVHESVRRAVEIT